MGEKTSDKISQDCEAASFNDDEDNPKYVSEDVPGLVEQLKLAISESQDWVKAEISLQKARVEAGGKIAKSMAIGLAVAILFFTCAFITLLLGIYIVVATYLSPILALVIVPITYALSGYLAVRYALAKMRKLKIMVRETGGIGKIETEQHTRQNSNDETREATD